jgi:release factor glutamine methyltransferase
MTPRELLAIARDAGVARLDALALIAQASGRDRTWLLAHDDEALPHRSAEAARSTIERRARGEPLAYLVGEREFHALVLHVTPDVLIPRPDTETLVAWALEVLARAQAAAPHVLDLGTGSGAIALAVKHARPGSAVTAIDLSDAALAVARANGQRLGLSVDWRGGHWMRELDASARFDLIVSNPPYVRAADPHLLTLAHEPALALVGGEDGLHALREIVDAAPQHLAAGAWLLLEHGFDQADAVSALLRERGFAGVQSRRDLAGQPRCTGGCWRDDADGR